MGERVLMQRDRSKIEDVLKILKKNAALTVKQEKFCNDECIERFLKVKGENVKKAARHLRACLSWRESIGTDYLIADEFAAELAEGTAYIAGRDQEARPVVVFRIKQDYQKLHSQKRYIRLLVFTLEVAAASMPKGVEQLILLFDASFYRSASAFLALFMATMKILSEFYPGRLHRAFVVDSPNHFPFLWKGARPFVDQWASTMLVSSPDYDDPITPPEFSFSSNPRACSLRGFTPPPTSATATNKVGPSSSSRFSFTVSHLDSLKPWYLSKSVAVPVPAPTPTPSDISPALSPLSGRSLSFASPAGRSCQPTPRTPRPSFLHSPAAYFRRPDSERLRGDLFRPYAVFLRRPYNEASYRAMMRPPMAGLVAIVSGQHLKRRPDQQQFSFHSQRFSTIDYSL